MNQFVVFVVLSLVACCQGYSLGPPLGVCSHMIPGHNVSATTNPPAPFSFTLNATEYSPGDVIEVFLNSSGGWFMEGIMVQARSVDCHDEVTSFGRFSVPTNDTFLRPMDCFGKTASALGHYSHLHIYNRTFYWTAPSPAVGHLFLKATIVRKETIFWTDVHSEFIYDRSNNTRSGLTKDATCGADVNRLTASLFVAIPLFFLLIIN